MKISELWHQQSAAHLERQTSKFTIDVLILASIASAAFQYNIFSHRILHTIRIQIPHSIMVAPNAIIAAFSSTALISLAPNVLLLLFPRFASGEGHNSPILSLGQALAAGGLLGDVFLHVVPHSGGSHNVGLWILLGFSVFLLTDMILRSMGGGHKHAHAHGHSHTAEDKSEGKCEGDSSSSGELKTSTILLNLTADALHNVSSKQKLLCKLLVYSICYYY